MKGDRVEKGWGAGRGKANSLLEMPRSNSDEESPEESPLMVASHGTR